MPGRSLLGTTSRAGVVLLASITVAYGAEPVVPEQETGADLKQRLELLDKDTDLADRFVAVRAVGYIDGIADAAVGLGYACYPTAVTRAEIREVVIKYLRDHPERLGDQASMLVLNGLFDAFPCMRQE
jgi:hypothetical protein